jgi:hypothetical protein
MVTFDGGSTATAPLAGQIEVVCALATNVTLTDMLLSISQHRAAPM